MEGLPAVAIVPARYSATRFPGKLLARLHGRTLLALVHERLRAVRGLQAVIIATDDERIAEEARSFGADVRLTSPAHASGTDRIGEVLASLDPVPAFILNLQGDEPLFSPRAVERLLAALRSRPDAIWTLAEPIHDRAEFLRPSVVKVVTAPDGRALYFSRAPIPCFRDREADSASRLGKNEGAALWPEKKEITPLRHVGVYGYPVQLLRAFLAAGPGCLERVEGLEQLRALELGQEIRVLLGAWPDSGVDTPEDLERLLRRYPTREALERTGME